MICNALSFPAQNNIARIVRIEKIYTDKMSNAPNSLLHLFSVYPFHTMISKRITVGLF
jgi:hypothetical protein